MARTKTTRVQCNEPTCKEWGFFEYDNLRERQQIDRKKWSCTRHASPERLLSTEKRLTQVSYVIGKSGRYPDMQHSYWIPQGHKDLESGFVFGPGFKGFAEDFPEGTKLTITAEVVLPTREES